MKQVLCFIAIVVAALAVDGQGVAQEQANTKKQPTRYIVTDLGLAADQTAGIATSRRSNEHLRRRRRWAA